MHPDPIVIVGYARTPIGTFRGVLGGRGWTKVIG